MIKPQEDRNLSDDEVMTRETILVELEVPAKHEEPQLETKFQNFLVETRR